MRNIYIYIFFFVLLFQSCQDSNQYHIIGTALPEMNGETVELHFYLYTEGTNVDILKIDSVVIENGKFSFTGEKYLDNPTVIALKDGRWRDVFLDKGKINVKITHDNITATGTPLNNLYQAYINFANDIEAIKELMLNNQSGHVGKVLFFRISQNMPYREYKELYAILDDEFKNDTYVSTLDSHRDIIEKAASGKYSIRGTQYSDILLSTTTGETVKLSDYVGKYEYVFLDLWASWCGPCIEEMPGVKRISDMYADRGVKVLGVSIDEKRSDWLAALDKLDTSSWQQLLVAEDMEEAKRKYNIWGIPDGVLINKEGVIVVNDIRPSRLDAYLEMLLEQ